MSTLEDARSCGEVSRRNFLTGAAVLAAGSAVAAAVPRIAHAEEAAPAAESTGEDVNSGVWKGVKLAIGHVVHDPSICSGCRTCEIVCATAHEGVASSELSRIQWTKDLYKAEQTDIMTCKQCPGPECVEVCPQKALTIDEVTGARVIDEGKCVGCQLCLQACPVEPSRIRYNPEKQVCFKCDLCGGDPQCVKFCPMGALRESWVEYEDLGAEDDFYEKDFTGEAAAYTHMETNTIQLTEVPGGVQLDAVIWTSHATKNDVFMNDYTVTADALDANGNVLGSTKTPGTASIPEMSSAALSILIEGVSDVEAIGKIVIHAEGIPQRNAM